MRTPISILGMALLNVVTLQSYAASNGADAGFDLNASPEASHQLGEHLWFGADIITSLEYTNNLDLQDADDHLLHLEPEVRAVLSTRPVPNIRAYGEFQVDGRAFISQGDANEEHSEGHIRIEQAYLRFEDILPNTSLQVGRQRFKDPRTWWYDEKIDAVRTEWQRDEWFASASIAKEKIFPDDLSRADTDEQVDYYLLSGGLDKGKRDITTLYLIKKNDQESNDRENPIFFGLQRIGEFERDIGNIGTDSRYWVNAAIVRGHADDARVKAYGFDGGVSVRLDAPMKPFITFGLAYGSGDAHTSDGEDGNFRQTGLQDNESRTFGISSYNYYGEVLDLELSNLRIGTLGAGIKPNNNLSAELVYHRYSQVSMDDDIYDSDLEIDPTGDHSDLGQELDLIVAYRPSDKIKLSFVLGAFFPGDAFDANSETALAAKLKLAYRF